MLVRSCDRGLHSAGARYTARPIALSQERKHHHPSDPWATIKKAAGVTGGFSV